MTTRQGQTWQEGERIFTVVGPPIVTEFYERHPVCFLDADLRVMAEEKYMDEGDITWEEMPYMTRLT